MPRDRIPPPDSTGANPKGSTEESDGRFSRQTIYGRIGSEGQERLGTARVLIVGCGALGSHTAEYLARAGVGSLRLVDRDVVEWSNLHRQIGFDEADARERAPKATALARHLARANSSCALEPQIVDFNWTTALELVSDCDLFLDGTDNVAARFLLNDVSYKRKVPWVYAGAIGDSAHVQFFSGNSGPCLRCQLPEPPPPGVLQTCDTAGVIAPAVGAAASWQAALALRFLVERNAESLAGRKARLALWSGEARVVQAGADPECSVCVEGIFSTLEGEHAERATLLCGRGAVQVLPGRPAAKLDLAALASRLEPLGAVEARPGLLRFAGNEGCRMTVFPDGRALFDGLTDLAQARSLYARLIGQ